MSEEVKCKDCAFWRKIDGTKAPVIGDCHRFPPTENKITHSHPRTAEDTWCGEWATKKVD